MNKTKTLPLSLTDIIDLIELDDTRLMLRAIDLITKAFDDPDKVTPADLDRAPRIARTIVERLKADKEAAAKRAEAARQRRAQAKEQKAKEQEAAQTPDSSATLCRQRHGATPGTIEVKINENVAKRLLWIKQHFPAIADAISRVLTAYQVTDPRARQTFSNFNTTVDLVTDYLRPLIEAASSYFRTPKRLRPASITIPA